MRRSIPRPWISLSQLLQCTMGYYVPESDAGDGIYVHQSYIVCIKVGHRGNRDNDTMNRLSDESGPGLGCEHKYLMNDRRVLLSVKTRTRSCRFLESMSAEESPIGNE